MPWDIYIQDLPNVATVSDIPSEFEPSPLGEREVLVAKILEALPEAERQDKDWIFLKQEDVDLSIQVHMEDSTRVRYLLVQIHGGKNSPDRVARIVRALGYRALDTATGEWFDPAKPERGYAIWKAGKGN